MAGNVVLRELFAGDIGKVSALAQELDERRAVEETGHADEIVDVVAIQPEGRRRHDVVGSAFLKLVGRQYRWFRAVRFAFRDELKIVRRDVKNAAGGAIGKRHGKTAFAGDQPNVTDRRAAKVTRIVTQIGADTAARPVAENTTARPVITRVQGAGPPDDGFQFRWRAPDAGGADGFPGRHALRQGSRDAGSRCRREDRG